MKWKYYSMERKMISTISWEKKRKEITGGVLLEIGIGKDGETSASKEHMQLRLSRWEWVEP